MGGAGTGAESDDVAHGGGGGGRGENQFAVGGEAGAEFAGGAGLAFGEVGGFLGVGVVFALGAALFVGSFVAGELGGADLEIEVGLELREEGGAQRGAIDHARLVGEGGGFGEPENGTAADCGRSGGAAARGEEVVCRLDEVAGTKRRGHVVERAEFKAEG